MEEMSDVLKEQLDEIIRRMENTPGTTTDYLLNEMHRRAENVPVAKRPLEELERMYGMAEGVAARLGKECADLPEMLKAFGGNPEVKQRIVDIASDAIDLLLDLSANQVAVFEEIQRRIRSNNTNCRFGRMLMGNGKGDIATALEDYKELQRILGAIPFKNDWFPKDLDHWMGAIDEVLTVEAGKHSTLSVAQLARRMAENGFAYIYVAAERQMIDLMRYQKARAKEIPVDPVEFLDKLPGPTTDTDADAEQTMLIRLVDGMMLEVPPWSTGILKAITTGLTEERELIESLSVRDVGAWVKKEAAQERHVTVQQAREDLRRLQARQDFDTRFAQIRDGLAALATKPLPSERST